MLNSFLPNDYVKSIFEITPDFLKNRGIKGIITDLDNTLVAWDRPSATPELAEWFKEMKDSGIQVVIVSNNSERRVHEFANPLNIPYIFKAQKPIGKSFMKALSIINVAKDKTVVIGDQLLTDILGGNRAGFHTILVVPVSQTDGLATKLNRTIERRILNWFHKKGMLKWEGAKE